VALVASLKLGPSPQVSTSEGKLETSEGKLETARSAFPSCEAAAKSCVTHFSDHTSYPNIAAGFRGFNVVLGGVEAPSNPAGKRGFIFDEANERSGKVRFNNIAGERFAQCTSDLEVRIIRTVEEMFDSKTSTEISSSSLQIGNEFNVNLGIDFVGTLGSAIMNQVGSLLGSSVGSGSSQQDDKEVHGSAHAEACAEASVNGLVASGSVSGCVGVELGGSLGQTTGQSETQSQSQQASEDVITESGTSFTQGATAGIGFTIPPIAKSLASNNERVQTIATSIDSKQVITTVASTHCKRYAYQLQSYSPPAFHAAFKRGLTELNKCWNASADANINSFQCARNFIDAYGTHFVKRAIFGAKVTTTRVLDFGKANNETKKKLDDCTRSQSTWSALGVFTDGDKSSDCQNDLSTGSSISHTGLQKEHTESVGCKPSVDYGDDGPFPPEIIEKTLGPISDLFTSEFMTEERVGTTIDFVGIGPWLYDKILDYCVLFKREHHCKHTNRLQYSCAHCPGVDPKRSIGFYTGGLDEDFLPHTPGQEGVLNIASDPPQQFVTSWEHGCPAVKCVVSDWTSWSSCSATSGLGNQERTRKVIQEPHLMGMPCPDLTQTRWCKPGVIMTGGTNYETGNLNTVESYPPTCSIPNLPTVRYGHTTSLLNTSPPTIVVCGGYGEGSGLFTSDPAPYDCVAWRSGMADWSEHFDLGVPRSYHSAWVPQGQNTKIVLFGGDSSGAMKTADVVGGGRTFELRNSGLNTCSISLSSTVLLTGGSDDESNVHSAVDRYDAAGFVEAMPSMRTGRQKHACGRIQDADGRSVLVVAGGTGTYAASYAALDTAEILHQTETGQWASAWTFGPRLPRALSGVRAAPLEHRLLLTGGLDVQETYHDSVLELSILKLEDNYWTQVGSLEETRSAHGIIAGNLSAICG